MPMFPAPRWRSLAGRRTALPLLLTLLLTPAAACRAWRAEPLPAPGARAALVVAAEHARLTRLDGRVDELLDARVERDTVRGDLLGPRGREGAVAVPLDSVRRLQVRHVSGALTAALAGGLVLLYSGLGGFQAW